MPVKFHFPLLLSFAFPLLAVSAANESQSVDISTSGALYATDYVDALEKAKAGDRDIVVLQRGSDWNVLGERIFNELWSKETFAKELGNGFVLVTVDRQESFGSEPLSAGRGETTPFSRLSRSIAPGSPLPKNQITSVSSEQRVSYAKRADGAFAIAPDETKKPERDTITFTLKPSAAGSVLRLDFPVDPKDSTSFPGCAANGNFVLSEVVVTVNGAPAKLETAWSDLADATGALTPAEAIDGISDTTYNGWNGRGDVRQNRFLLLTLASTVPADATVSVKLSCLFGTFHIPRALSASILPGKQSADDLRAVTQAQALATKNAKFDWFDICHCPRIALMDCQGKPVAEENAPRPKTVSELLKIVRRLESVRMERDELLVKAAKESGEAKALTLVRMLDLVGMAHSNTHPRYSEIRTLISEADPEDKSGATRRLSFGPDPRDPVPWADKVAMQGMVLISGSPMSVRPGATDADFQAALAAVDAELKDPRNKVLHNEQIQRMMLAKYHLYKVWPGHEDLRFDVQREIAAFDPTTVWGVGATGYCAMYHRKEDTPMLYYGWTPGQLVAGTSTWDMTDTAVSFDHAGPFTLSIHHAGGNDAVRIVRASMMDGETAIATGTPAKGEDQVVTGKVVKIPLDLSAWKAGRAYKLRIEVETQPGKLDNTGTFSVMPEFVTPAGWAAPPIPSSVDPKLRTRIERGNMDGWLTELRALLCSAARFSPGKMDETTRKQLAQYELLRACSPEKTAEVAKAEGGAAFLMTLMDDTEWMEVFLASPSTSTASPDSLENLRILWTYAHADFGDPFLKRLATAMSLASGNSLPPYGLLDRYTKTKAAWNDGLLHAGFKNLSVRLMRMSICVGPFTATGYDMMLNELQLHANDYVNAAGLCRYLGYNVYGDWVQNAALYHVPWMHKYTGSVSHIRIIGGVCGSCSNYGNWQAVAHGVPAAIAFQPAHCCYMVKLGDEWVATNLASGISDCTSSIDWEGAAYSTTRYLREQVESDWPAYIGAARFIWLGSAQIDQATAKKSKDTGWIRSYEAALAAQPTNFPNWINYAKRIEANPTALDGAARIDLAMRAARSLRFEHQAAYVAALRILGPTLAELAPARREEVMLALNRELRQESVEHFLPYVYILGHFDTQAKLLGDPALETAFFGKLLAIHYSDNPSLPGSNWIFGQLMAWGNNRFAKNPATSSGYIEAIASFFTSRSGGVDTKVKQAFITDGIRRSSDSGQSDTYHLWVDMADKLLPPLKPETVGIATAQAAAQPKIEPFPGILLSAKGMLQLSGHSSLDLPHTYGKILDGSGPGYFDIAWQAKPWAQVQFTGDVDVSGIVLVDTYDKPEQLPWAIPLKVMVSTDGMEWTEIARIEKPSPVHRIDLQGKASRVRFVRIERDGLGTNPDNCLFHMRNFLIYGKTLY